MATTIQNIDVLCEYLSQVMEKADDHATGVNEIALAIAGGIIWKTTRDIRVMSRNGEMKNVLWLQAGERRLCFSYNHDSGRIEVREGTMQGTVIQEFDNSTPIAQVRVFFEGL